MDRVICVILCIVAMVVAINILIYCGQPTAEAITTPTTQETTGVVTEPTETVAPTTATTEPAEETTVATEPTEEATIPTEPPYTADELEMMALVIYTEAGGDACSDKTRLMVGNVVMNRVSDSRFPSTLCSVLMQEGQYGRFYWTGLVWPAKASDPTEEHAVERAYACAERVLLGEKLLPEDVIWQAEFIQGTEVVTYQDGMYFCR